MIEIVNISKTFKIPKGKKDKNIKADPREQGNQFHAVMDVSFTAKKGAITGLLGPNGAGKTTLLRLLSTALKPTSGKALIDGIDAAKNPLEVRKKIGFLSGTTGLYGRLTGREICTFFGQLHGMDPDRLKERQNAIFKQLDMEHYVDRRADKLSAGMKQKVSIARTMIHDPEIVVFDEPTTGLDVAAAQAILDFIHECMSLGKTVIFSTHHMHEVSRLCSHIVMVDLGRKTFEGSAQNMLTETGMKHLDEAFLKLMGREVNYAA